MSAKIWSLTALIVITLFLIVLAVASSGCAPVGPQPKLIGDNHVMVIPEGTKIGKEKAPEDGIYIGRSRILGLDVIPLPKKRNPERHL